jgi:hypothetical protein
MEIRKGGKQHPDWRFLPVFRFLFSIFCFLILSACGSPGDPTPPRVVVPDAVKDLTARQEGERVVLSFTLPQKSSEGETLEALPDVEILRGNGAQTAAVPASMRHVYTIPSALVETYLRDGRFVFSDPLKPEDLAAPAGQNFVYVVQTRVSKRKASENSNTVTVRILPAAVRIADLSATLTESAVELRWTAPDRLVNGAQIPTLGSYRIFRAEIDPSAPPETAAAATSLLGVSPVAQYRDTQFEFGKTYVYSVRSVAQFEAASVESGDSNSVRIEAKDTFPPAPPQNLVAVPLAATPAMVELSWSISPETDVAGYHVYRMEAGAAEGTSPERINSELLLAPAFRDISVTVGRSYSYAVTAVDRAGNQSPRSTQVTVSVPN